MEPHNDKHDEQGQLYWARASSIGNCRQRALDCLRKTIEGEERPRGEVIRRREWFDPDPGAGTAKASDPISSSERARRPRTNDSSAPPSKFFFLSSRRRQRLTWSHEIRAEFVAAGQLDALSSAKVSAMASHIVCKLQRKLEYMYELLNSDDAGICSCSRDRMLVAEAGQRLGLFLKSVRVAVSCSVPASQQHLASPPHHHVREISLSGYSPAPQSRAQLEHRNAVALTRISS